MEDEPKERFFTKSTKIRTDDDEEFKQTESISVHTKITKIEQVEVKSGTEEEPPNNKDLTSKAQKKDSFENHNIIRNNIRKYYSSLNFDTIKNEYEYNEHNNSTDGIIYAIGTDFNSSQKWLNPAIINNNKNQSIILSSSPQPWSNRNVSDMIDINTKQGCYLLNKKNAWIIIDFVALQICPTHYTLNVNSYFALQNWDFEASLNGKEWTLLSRHQIDDKNKKEWTFRDFPIYTPQYFTQFRIRMTGKNVDNDIPYSLHVSLFEIYGKIKEYSPPYDTLPMEKDKNIFTINIEQTINTYGYQFIEAGKRKLLKMNNINDEKSDLKENDVILMINNEVINEDSNFEKLDVPFVAEIYRPKIFSNQGNEINKSTCYGESGLLCNQCNCLINTGDNYYSCNYMDEFFTKDGYLNVLCINCYNRLVVNSVRLNQAQTEHKDDEDREFEELEMVINDCSIYNKFEDSFDEDDHLMLSDDVLTHIKGKSVNNIGLKASDIKALFKYQTFPFKATFKRYIDKNEENKYDIESNDAKTESEADDIDVFENQFQDDSDDFSDSEVSDYNNEEEKYEEKKDNETELNKIAELYESTDTTLFLLEHDKFDSLDIEAFDWDKDTECFIKDKYETFNENIILRRRFKQEIKLYAD
eukprot:179637_1